MKKYLIPLVLLFFFFGCKDSSYNSPVPGIIEVRLKINRTDFEIIGNFNLTVESLKIETPTGSYADIYDNINAIRDNADYYDVFSSSEFIIGQMYLPPQTYSNLLLSITPSDSMTYDNKIIIVTKPADFDALYKLNMNKSINSDQKTTVTIRCDIDSILVKKIDHYEYRHKYSIESIIQE
jgi:hypothetical protein